MPLRLPIAPDFGHFHARQFFVVSIIGHGIPFFLLSHSPKIVPVNGFVRPKLARSNFAIPAQIGQNWLLRRVVGFGR